MKTHGRTGLPLIFPAKGVLAIVWAYVQTIAGLRRIWVRPCVYFFVFKVVDVVQKAGFQLPKRF